AACDVCRRVFWEGSHWRRMRTVVDAMRASPPPPAGERDA
ncbi:TPA: twitching motility protein PilT, partial [Burkholderia aenigmatica]|nr:twitching motility protein PilT [Burkholderia aenigmatica]